MNFNLPFALALIFCLPWASMLMYKLCLKMKNIDDFQAMACGWIAGTWVGGLAAIPLSEFIKWILGMV
jgi:hypothetical protein